MGMIRRLADGLTSALTGMGRTSDPRTANRYVYTPKTRENINAAYRGSGIMRKIVNAPADDMIREWREWKADADQIAAIEAEEARLAILHKIRKAEVLRGLGGGAMLLGLPGNPEAPAPASVGQGGLAYVHVFSRWQCQLGDEVTDLEDPRYGQPAFYRLSSKDGQMWNVHPSRIISFQARPLPNLLSLSWEDEFWGESVVEQVLDAVENSDAAQSAFASLIQKAHRLRIGVRGLSELVSTQEGEQIMAARFANLALSESIYNATVYELGADGQPAEQVDDVTYNFAGMKDVMNAFGEFVAAVSDIPATRLLGRAPEGMNASGESQQKDWNKKVRARQTIELKPCLDRLDQYLIPSALGSRPADIWYDFAPLDNPSEKEMAEYFKVGTDGIEKLQATNTIPEVALAKGVQSWMVEHGFLPGLESALEETPESERYPETPDDDGTDPSAMQAPAEGGDPASAGGGATRPARRAVSDVALGVIRAGNGPLVDATPEEKKP